MTRKCFVLWLRRSKKLKAKCPECLVAVYWMPLFPIFADFSFVTPSEVPDWSMSVEIGASSFQSHTFCHRFEVSPEHSPGKTATHKGTNEVKLGEIQTDRSIPQSRAHFFPFLSLSLCCDLPDFDETDHIIQVSITSLLAPALNSMHFSLAGIPMFVLFCLSDVEKTSSCVEYFGHTQSSVALSDLPATGERLTLDDNMQFRRHGVPEQWSMHQPREPVEWIFLR